MWLAVSLIAAGVVLVLVILCCCGALVLLVGDPPADYLSVTLIDILSDNERTFVNQFPTLHSVWGYKVPTENEPHSAYELTSHFDIGAIQDYTDILFRNLWRFFTPPVGGGFYMSDTYDKVGSAGDLHEHWSSIQKQQARHLIKQFLNSADANGTSIRNMIEQISQKDLDSNSSIPFASFVLAARSLLQIEDGQFKTAYKIMHRFHKHVKDLYARESDV